MKVKSVLEESGAFAAGPPQEEQRQTLHASICSSALALASSLLVMTH